MIKDRKTLNAELDRCLGERLRDLRTSRGLSLSSLAEALDVSYQQIQKYESGLNAMSLTTVYRICTHLKVPISIFMEGTESSPELILLDNDKGRSHKLALEISDLSPTNRLAILEFVDSLTKSNEFASGVMADTQIVDQ